jgi:hypothetical protein
VFPHAQFDVAEEVKFHLLDFFSQHPVHHPLRVGLEEQPQPTGQGFVDPAVAAPDFAVQQKLPLSGGGHLEQGQGVFGADVLHQEVEVLLRQGMDQGQGLPACEDRVEGLCGRQRQNFAAPAAQGAQLAFNGGEGAGCSHVHLLGG